MSFLNYTITAPYYYYLEETDYNVIPATIALTFSSPPSTNGADYIFIVTDSGDMNSSQILIPSIYDSSLAISGNTATVTMNITYDDCVITVSYQGTHLPFFIRARLDPTRDTPGIWKGFPDV